MYKVKTRTIIKLLYTCFYIYIMLQLRSWNAAGSVRLSHSVILRSDSYSRLLQCQIQLSLRSSSRFAIPIHSQFTSTLTHLGTTAQLSTFLGLKFLIFMCAHSSTFCFIASIFTSFFQRLWIEIWRFLWPYLL